MLQKSINKSVVVAAILAASVMFGSVPGCAQESPQPPAVTANNADPAFESTTPPPNAQEAVVGDPAQPPRWPLVVDSAGDQVIMYQPQLETFEGDKITARAAVSIQKPDQQEPVFGVVWLESQVATDRSARTVQILDANITKAHFPDAPPADEAALLDALRQRLAEHPKILSLDTVLKMLEVAQQETAQAANLQNTPPKIIFMQQPAVKVQYDGAPRLAPVAGSNLLRVINTPFFVGLDPSQKVYYLKGGGQWFSAPDPMGPFQPAATAPAAIAALADQSGYQDPQQLLSAQQAAQVQIVTSTEPSELIWTDGPEEMGTIAGTNLIYVTNTDSDVFMELGSQQLYVLLSGRWYTAPSRNGPWTFVAPDQLPADFARIPPNSPKGQVLAHVPGTPVAQDAVADTYIPQTATLERAQVEQPPVSYDGDPQFQPVEGVPCTYAVNTSYSVVQVNRRYYCCYQAAWYEAAAPVGPWAICISVPSEIYLLPPSCPIYPVRYVHVYGYTPEVVYVGYTPGYVGCYAYNGCVVYGTGYRYQPWVGREHYYSRPYTFGYAPRYESYTGHWGFEVGRGAGGGEAWLSQSREREPGHDRSVPGGHWFGNGGYRPVTVNNTVINNYTNVNKTINKTVNNNRQQTIVNRGQLAPTYNLYERRTDVRKQGPAPSAVRSAPAGRPAVSNARPAPAARPASSGRPAAQASRVPAANVRDNVFADPAGNVHRKTLDGWQARQGNKWVPQNGQPPAGQKTAPKEAAPSRQTPVAHEAPNPAPHTTQAPAQRDNTKAAPRPGAAPREAPSATPHQTPAAPVHQTPNPAAHPAPRQPSPPSGTAALDRDLSARVAGRDRYQNSPKAAPAPRPAQPAARPEPAPRQPAARPEPAPRQPAARQEPAPRQEPASGARANNNNNADSGRQGAKK